MERLQERLNSAKRALNAFEQVLKIEEPNDIERDACIQRFEFTYEASWKAAKQYLYDVEGIDIGSPKGVIRSSREVNLLTDDESITALQMVNDRNLTVHTYNEEVANKIYSNVKTYFNILNEWVDRMDKNIGQESM